ncbi:MAG TPA: T9SS type A sorting domain-containing protein [Flavisolibacter sp.]
MRRIFTSFAALACFIAISGQASAQCTDLNPQICNDPNYMVASFPMTPPPGGETNAQGFTSASFAAEFGGMRLVGADALATYTLRSPNYYASSTTNVQIGFKISKNAAADIATLTINVYTAGGVLLGSCVISDPGGNANSFDICKVIGLSPFVSGLIYYEFVFTMDGNLGGGSATIQFDDFVIAGDFQAPLPVTFVSLVAEKATSGVELTWVVADEDNVASYDIERSTDGINFTKVGSVQSQKLTTYSYIDSRISTAPAFYRVKSVDIDGKYGYSSIVKFAGNKSSVVIRAFPSPAVNELFVQHDVAVLNAKITVTTLDGKVVRTINPTRGTQQTTISMASVAPGMYIVRFDNGLGSVETIKIVKQ